MSTNTTDSIPGMLLPTQRGMIDGNPRDSAIAAGNAANLKLQALQSIGGRGRRLRKRRGGADTIPVPQFSMQYTPQGGPGQDPNSIIQQNAAVGTQSAANAVYDKYATQTGGEYIMNTNTNTNQYQWGCYSGGKKYKKSKMRKSKMRKSKKKRTSRNISRIKKSKKNKKR